jgi:hypothetical protein
MGRILNAFLRPPSETAVGHQRLNEMAPKENLPGLGGLLCKLAVPLHFPDCSPVPFEHFPAYDCTYDVETNEIGAGTQQ